ncbi:hypothetical protein Enr13x_53510 [Stieleria neptunia]|uniref:PhoD-like phosphatase n=1 Tax=Stieleria neptunia TaxID=2527979 RepID=A0A518HX86_9BACT|nr:hypothetical protein [Stieleria neptunia]QDV45472.1 hypothetical protein Enr13x_53510 [Stieleria neptunia]
MTDSPIDRRQFVKRSAALASAGMTVAHAGLASAASKSGATEITFPRQDSLVHPPEWESLNPGYWKIENGRLRRRLSNVGDRARRTGFPFHSESKGGVMETEYDPSLPAGILYRRDHFLTGRYSIDAQFVYHADAADPVHGDDPAWKMYQRGDGLMGIAIGSKNLLESFNRVTNATQIAWSDDGKLHVISRGKATRGAGRQQVGAEREAFDLSSGDLVNLRVDVVPDGQHAQLSIVLSRGSDTVRLTQQISVGQTEGYVGVLGRGLIDFSVNALTIEAEQAPPLTVRTSPCLACYALGDTLQKNDAGEWTVRFVGIFESDGKQAELRIATSERPASGWKSVSVAGHAKIINNDFRRNTAVIEAVLPENPGAADLYYTVWKDGGDVTADPRIGTDAVGPGTGLVGDVPESGNYVGRLPRLVAPYRLCGLSCHAITSGLQQKTVNGYTITGGNNVWQFRDQPTEGAYAHLEAYDFQVMVWEDDVWYMELVLYPPSTDDAYKIVTQSICGPTSRWQLMRHWNVINPGDHDYGMDDVKGPEQIIIRRQDGLGQDASYMRRNFQIVHHLITGDEEVDPLANPKKWRAWKMPHRDFTFVITDSRLWRSSQNVDVWREHGWGAFKSLYDRTDPTRSLLGEEQFAWLQELLATDSSRLMCLTGINGLHTIWTGGRGDFESGKHPMKFSQRDRVTADYAGWVKAGADRVLELLGGRDGVVTVYGDVHNGSIMTNQTHRVIESSFGPIGRSGGRGVIPGFGPQMKDVDGRDLTIHCLYHKEFSDPNLSPHADGEPFYWNFLEMEFDPGKEDPSIDLRIRNLVDPPQQTPRGGGSLQTTASQTGRLPASRLPQIKTIPDAEVQILDLNGRPIRGTTSLDDGRIVVSGLVDVDPGEQVLVLAHRDEMSEVKQVHTLPVDEG